MGDKTGIEWTDATWNPVTGCTKVSQGCKHCYAERVFPRAYAKTGRKFGEVQCHPERLDQPLRWARPRRIFVNSMSDLFHEDVPDDFIDQVFAIMAIASTERYRCFIRGCDHELCHESSLREQPTTHQFQILTKRADRLARYLRSPGRIESIVAAADQCGWVNWGSKLIENIDWPIANVWLGVSVEDQETADERIPLLLQTPAAVRFVSYEPALGPVDFTRLPVPREVIDESFGERGGEFVFNALTDADDDHFFNRHPKLNWIIAGGESGPNARPAHPDWFRSVRDQCQEADVPFFFKQWGEWAPVCAQYPRTEQEHDQAEAASMCGDIVLSNDGYEWPEREQPSTSGNPWLMDRVGKKRAGSLLDGREWKEFPTIGGQDGGHAKGV